MGIGFLTAFGCASSEMRDGDREASRDIAAATKPSSEANSGPNSALPASASPDDPNSLLQSLSKRVETLETQIASLNDKLDSMRPNIEQRSAGDKKTLTTGVASHPSDKTGALVQPRTAQNDPDAGFENNDAIQSFRKAMIFYQGQKLAESILAFSEFLAKYPDHPVAGSAQFYIGKAYFDQKEYKLAIQEFQRVLTSYDRSAHVSDTLSEMASAEEKLKNLQEASKHRQLLSSLFPQSPAAASLLASKTVNEHSSDLPPGDKLEDRPENKPESKKDEKAVSSESEKTPQKLNSSAISENAPHPSSAIPPTAPIEEKMESSENQ